MEDHIYPMEKEFSKLSKSSTRWTVHPDEEKLKEIAKRQGLWNLWLPVCSLFILSLMRLRISTCLAHTNVTSSLSVEHMQQTCWFLFLLSLYSSIVLLGHKNYFLMGAMTIRRLISCWVQASQILSMVTFVKSWVVQFGLHKCLIVGHQTLEIWRYVILEIS